MLLSWESKKRVKKNWEKLLLQNIHLAFKTFFCKKFAELNLNTKNLPKRNFSRLLTMMKSAATCSWLQLRKSACNQKFKQATRRSRGKLSHSCFIEGLSWKYNSINRQTNTFGRKTVFKKLRRYQGATEQELVGFYRGKIETCFINVKVLESVLT